MLPKAACNLKVPFIEEVTHFDAAVDYDSNAQDVITQDKTLLLDNFAKWRSRTPRSTGRQPTRRVKQSAHDIIYSEFRVEQADYDRSGKSVSSARHN